MSIYLNFGNGADGNVTISSNFNAQTGVGKQGTSGAGGSGGSIMIQAGTLYSNASYTTAVGGTEYRDSVNPPARSGGDGRTAIYYKLLGDGIVNVSPAPYTSTDVIAPYKISGTLTDAADIYLFKEESGSYQEKITVSGLNYEFRTSDDSYYMLVAKPHDVNKAGSVYTRIIPIAT